MKTFQQPLSTAEEAHYIQVLQQGNNEEAAKAREILIERNLRLVAHIAKKYQNVDEDMEDLISIGTIGLIKAISSFDAGKGKLSTYASRCIDNELLMLLRSKKKSSREVSLFEPIGTDKEGNEINLLDIIEHEQEDVTEQMELCDNIKKMAGLLNEVLTEREREQMELCDNIKKMAGLLDKVLTDREREIIFLRYGLATGKEVTQREIGELLHISRSYVSRIEKKALLKLQAEFKEKE